MSVSSSPWHTGRTAGRHNALRPSGEVWLHLDPPPVQLPAVLAPELQLLAGRNKNPQPMGDVRRNTIVAFVEQHGSIRVSDVAGLFSLSNDRSRVILRELVRRGVLEKHGSGRYTYYALAR